MRDLRTMDDAPGAPSPVAAEPAPKRNPRAARKAAAPRGWIVIGAPVLGYALFIAPFFVVGFVEGFAFRGTPQALAWRAFLNDLAQGHIGYAANMAAFAVSYIAILLMAWLLLPKRGPAALSNYFRRVSFPTLALAVFTGFALVVALVATQSQLIVHHVTDFHTAASEQAILPTSTANVLPGVVAVGIVGPIVEEVYFRGIMLRWLGTWMPVSLAALLSAILFAAAHAKFALHQEFEALILSGELAVVGLVLAIWTLAARSLWPSIIVHGTYNATLIMLPLLATSMKVS